MKKPHRRRKDEPLHEWLHRLMADLPIRRMDDHDLYDLLHDISVESYIKGSNDREAIEAKLYPRK